MLRETETRVNGFFQNPEFIVRNPSEIEATPTQIVRRAVALYERESGTNFLGITNLLEDLVDHLNVQKHIGWEVWNNPKALSSMIIKEAEILPSPKRNLVTKLLMGDYNPQTVLPQISKTLSTPGDVFLLNKLAEWKDHLAEPAP